MIIEIIILFVLSLLFAQWKFSKIKKVNIDLVKQNTKLIKSNFNLTKQNENLRTNNIDFKNLLDEITEQNVKLIQKYRTLSSQVSSLGVVPRVRYNLLMPKPRKSKVSQFEKKVGFAIKQLFPGFNFVPVRPSWLRNPETGYSLEYDYYNHCLRLAIEVQGDQHRKYIPHFHKTYDNFIKQLTRDEIKRKSSKLFGVTLIEVWAGEDYVDQITKQLTQHNITHDCGEESKQCSVWRNKCQ
jgi:hypothetical protein